MQFVPPLLSPVKNYLSQQPPIKKLICISEPFDSKSSKEESDMLFKHLTTFFTLLAQGYQQAVVHKFNGLTEKPSTSDRRPVFHTDINNAPGRNLSCHCLSKMTLENGSKIVVNAFQPCRNKNHELFYSGKARARVQSYRLKRSLTNILLVRAKEKSLFNSKNNVNVSTSDLQKMKNASHARRSNVNTFQYFQIKPLRFNTELRSWTGISGGNRIDNISDLLGKDSITQKINLSLHSPSMYRRRLEKEKIIKFSAF
ncbi:uncharacterized protein LOC106672729 isoform X2 [Cimex lectularius]|uniref:Uncharacterized protein n=1 Tax=Cimex lectularius TaxID=79782 RepID=A0A8I6S726_CIMLE|nr:uncharacterized protein LOC106672729 isoform X2 [Cimex lectularius]